MISYTAENRLTQGILFANPAATDGHRVIEQGPEVAALFGIDPNQYHVTTELPRPDHIADIAEAVPFDYSHMHTLVLSSGGDRGVNKTVAAIIGHVENDPVATQANHWNHMKYSEGILYIPGAGGNARNFAVSSLGEASDNPHLLTNWLRTGQLRTRSHRPLVYELSDTNNQIIKTGIATSTIGIGGAARVAADIEKHKKDLHVLPRRQRLKRELGMMTTGLLAAPPFDMEVLSGRPDDQTMELHCGITGTEILYSPIYAKQGRASVSVADTEAQLLVARHHKTAPLRVISMLGVATQLRTGMYVHPKHDFIDNNMLQLTVLSDDPVPFHTDGEINDQPNGDTAPTLFIQKNQTLTIKLARVAVKTLVRAA